MCDVYHVMGIVTTCGLRVALECLLAAGRLCEVSVCVVTFT